MARVTMTAKEAAEYLGMCYQKLLELSATGEIPSAKIGRLYFYTQGGLDKWIQNKMDKPTKEQEAAELFDKKYPHLRRA